MIIINYLGIKLSFGGIMGITAVDSTIYSRDGCTNFVYYMNKTLNYNLTFKFNNIILQQL